MKISIDRLKIERKIELEYQDSQFQDKGLREHTLGPLNIKVNITLVGNENVRLVGEIEGEFELVCDRCCENFLQHKIIKVDTIFEIEKNELENRIIYIDSKIRDMVLVDFPMKTLCSNNCNGICLKCGVNLNKEKCKCISK
ncbi:MAG: DUF177 domain-containing protein [Clostridia bacterium]|nr:DUF177 domain-containing protein [Clostridia bacterium]